MLDYKKVETAARVFVSFFIDLNTIEDENRASFIENLLGFIYASKSILKGVEVAGILTVEQIEKINEELSAAVEQNISGEKTQKLFEVIKRFKAEVNDVGSDE